MAAAETKRADMDGCQGNEKGGHGWLGWKRRGRTWMAGTETKGAAMDGCHGDEKGDEEMMKMKKKAIYYIIGVMLLAALEAQAGEYR